MLNKKINIKNIGIVTLIIFLISFFLPWYTVGSKSASLWFLALKTSNLDLIGLLFLIIGSVMLIFDFEKIVTICISTIGIFFLFYRLFRISTIGVDIPTSSVPSFGIGGYLILIGAIIQFYACFLNVKEDIKVLVKVLTKLKNIFIGSFIFIFIMSYFGYLTQLKTYGEVDFSWRKQNPDFYVVGKNPSISPMVLKKVQKTKNQYSNSNFLSNTYYCNWCGDDYRGRGFTTAMYVVNQVDDESSPLNSYCSRKCAIDWIRSKGREPLRVN